MKVTAQRLYTDSSRTNVGTFHKPEWIPAARITVERGANARARIDAGNRFSKLRKAGC